jgi:hypothetical protein
MYGVQNITTSQTLDSIELKYCIASVAHALLLQSKTADTPLVAAELRRRLWVALESWIATFASRQGLKRPPLQLITLYFVFFCSSQTLFAH